MRKWSAAGAKRKELSFLCTHRAYGLMDIARGPSKLKVKGRERRHTVRAEKGGESPRRKSVAGIQGPLHSDLRPLLISSHSSIHGPPNPVKLHCSSFSQGHD